MLTQFSEQAAIWHGVEKLADGGEVGAVLQTIPGEERFGDRYAQEEPPGGGKDAWTAEGGILQSN